MTSREKSILIVDDDSRNIFALSALLKARGFKVDAATATNEAMGLLNHSTGIVLMDMMMPDMDGYESISLLKQQDESKHIPVIAVTAQAMAGDKEKCLAAGADDYVSKPVDVDMLMQKIETLMSKQ